MQGNKSGIARLRRRQVLEQETLPPSTLAFRHYLATYQLEPLAVAIKAGVRYMTIWRIWQGQPISRQYELLVRQGLLHLTGVPYTAPMLVAEEPEHLTGSLRNQ